MVMNGLSKNGHQHRVELRKWERFKKKSKIFFLLERGFTAVTRWTITSYSIFHLASHQI